MVYNFSKTESENIIGHFGQDFYQRLLNNIEVYSDKWNLEIVSLVDYFSVNCVFICRSKEFGDTVLKIGLPYKEVFTEVQVLKDYSGKYYCNIFDSDAENGVILEECIQPGIRLRAEQSLDIRLNAFSELFNGLHIAPPNANLYPTYFSWVDRITEFMSAKTVEHKELYLLMKKARDICSLLCTDYPRMMLLHGDLHHDNILLGSDNKYRIIDPKGVIGDPIFDIPRFILNEFYDEDNVPYDIYSTHVNTVADYFADSLCVPKDVITKCVFIETTMCNCWCIESNEAPNLDDVLHAEAVMNSIT